MATYPQYRARQTFQRQHQRRSISAFSADFFGLLFVVVAFVAATGYLAQRIGFNLSFIGSAATMVGYVDPNAHLNQSAGYAPGSVAAPTPGPPPPLLSAANAQAAAPAAAAPATGAGSAAAPAPYCPAGQQPAFQLGFADLAGQLGATMGQPTECEHPSNTTGDTQQKTSTGLAYYIKGSNLVAFTDGFNHWALAPQGLMNWTGDSPTPPAQPH